MPDGYQRHTVVAVDAAVLILRAFGHDASGRVVRFPEPLPGGGNHKPAWAGLISDAYPRQGRGIRGDTQETACITAYRTLPVSLSVVREWMDPGLSPLRWSTLLPLT